MGLTWRGLAAFANTIRRKYGRSLNAIPVCGSGFREDAARRHNSNALCTRPVHGPQFAVGPGTQIGAYLSIHFWRVSLQFGPALKQCTRARAHTPNLWVHARAERATAVRGLLSRRSSSRSSVLSLCPGFGDSGRAQRQLVASDLLFSGSSECACVRIMI